MDSLTKSILSLCLCSLLCVTFIESRGLNCLFTRPVTQRGYLLPKQSALMDIDTFTAKVYCFAIYRYAFTQVARTSRKSYAHQREATGSSSDSLQLRPFLKWELLLKEIICSKRERILALKSSSLWYGKLPLSHKVTSLEFYFYYARA